ncbi:hypothetical protein [Caulobacter sp. D5]|uniref:hypothetical protein n=2 Tax=unclassified Caulobacter TaxID=2648921 RepID=UPI0011B78DAD|nr:hypothetical protein [Caulobacter sp. D5]
MLKKRSANPVLEARFPIDGFSRSVAEAKVEPLLRSVVPIVGEKPHSVPYLIGSATLLQFRGQPVLVSCAHVFLDNPGVPIGYFDATGLAQAIKGVEHFNKEVDLAIIPLSSEVLDPATRACVMPEEVLGRGAPIGEVFYASVVGHPISAHRMMPGMRLDTPKEAYFDMASETEAGLVAVSFDRKRGAHGAQGHTTPRNPIGKSGGAIFGLPMIAGRLDFDQPARLVGVPRRWNRLGKVIEGASAAVVRSALESMC